VARQREVGLDERAPGPVERHAEAREQRRGRHARRPDRRAAGDAPARHVDAALVDAEHARARAHLDAHAAEPPLGVGREPAVEGRQQARPGLDEHDARVLGIEAPEVTRQRAPRDVGQRAGQLDAGRPAADDDEGQPVRASLG
jgi:hypothetical protein